MHSIGSSNNPFSDGKNNTSYVLLHNSDKMNVDRRISVYTDAEIGVIVEM